MKDIIVHSISQIDLSDIRMPISAVYDRPADYPEHCIARLFDVDKPTNVILRRSTVKEMQRYFRQTTLMFHPRDKGDPENLVGTWM